MSAETMGRLLTVALDAIARGEQAGDDLLDVLAEHAQEVVA